MSCMKFLLCFALAISLSVANVAGDVEIDPDKLEEALKNSAVFKKLQMRVTSGDRELAKIIIRTQVKVQKLEQTIRNLKKQTENCKVYHDGRCYFAEVSRENPVTLEQAKKACEAKGATIANLYSQADYDLVLDYLRSLKKPEGFMAAWTGLVFDARNNIPSLSDGTVIDPKDYLKWAKGYPLTGDGIRPAFKPRRAIPTLVGVLFQVIDGSTEHDGLVNDHPESLSHTVLCQF